jgi:hypothetical protein
VSSWIATHAVLRRACELDTNDDKVGEIVRVRRALRKQSYQQMTCLLYKVMRIEDHYLVTLRRLRYPDGGYQGHIPDILYPKSNIHMKRVVRVHTDYLYDPPAYTRYRS